MGSGSRILEDPIVGQIALIHMLRALRRQEKGQTLFYRALAAQAGFDDDVELVDRLNGLHADEQHHLSRLTARLMELGDDPDDLSDLPRSVVLSTADWEQRARDRETAEVAAYEAAIDAAAGDEATRQVLSEILESERHHLRDLGGKWMPA